MLFSLGERGKMHTQITTFFLFFFKKRKISRSNLKVMIKYPRADISLHQGRKSSAG